MNKTVKSIITKTPLALLFAVGLAACGSPANQTQAPAAQATIPAVQTPAPAATVATVETPAPTQLSTMVNDTLGVIYDASTNEFIWPTATTDWSAANIDHHMPYEEIVRLAMLEGEVNWVTSGSRGPDAAAEFMELYPGITVNIINMGSTDAMERFPREHAAGIFEMDVIRMADSEGVIYNEFKSRGLFHSYFPYDIVPHISDPSFLLAGMPSYTVLNLVYYNYTLFPEGTPISSWWDLTRPEWYGLVIAQDPLTNPRYLSALTTFVRYADEFAADYERVFGQPIELHPNSPTAAHEWMRRFFGNNVIIDNSGSSMNRTIGRDDQTEAFLGWGSSSGIRRNVDEGLHLAFAQLSPRISQPNTNFVYIFDQAPNPHAAKLLSRFLLGGQGDSLGIGNADRNLEGSWVVRNDIPDHPNQPGAIAEMNLFVHDGEFVYQNSPAVLDFLLTVR